MFFLARVIKSNLLSERREDNKTNKYYSVRFLKENLCQALHLINLQHITNHQTVLKLFSKNPIIMETSRLSALVLKLV